MFISSKTIFKIGQCFIFLLFISIFYSCKTEVLKKEYDTEMVVSVVTEVDGVTKPLANATVAIFDKLEDYTASIRSRKPIKPVQQLLTDANGVLTFNDLSSETDIWVAAFYKDTTVFVGKTLLYDNDKVNFELVEKFRKGSVNKVTIKLIPADGVVSFIASTVQPSFPVDFYISYDSLTVLSKTDVVSSVAKKGTQTWRAKSAECDWYGTVNVEGGKNSLVQLPPCQTGTLGFYSLDQRLELYPITIRFASPSGVLEDVAQINSAYLSNPNGVTCDSIDFNGSPDYAGVKFIKGNGFYNYDAISADNNCRWVGRISVNVGGCATELLNVCQK